MRFSANLGFLFRDLSLPEAIRAAKSAGFTAVEMHWPYDQDPRLIKEVLIETGLPLLGINTPRGNVEAGDFGLCGVPNRENEARETIDQAVAWAELAGAHNIHVMAGKSSGETALDTLTLNLRYATDVAGTRGIGILIEPLNARDMPGYLINDLASALSVIEAAGGAARLMFDCYHLQIIQGDLLETFKKHRDLIGHMQCAAVPDRAEPDHGEVDYHWLLPALVEAGYGGWFGAEYRGGKGDFEWMKRFENR